MRAIVPILLLTLAIPAFSQTLTEQLQKGIYTEDVIGDLVAAERIYRQIGDAPALPEIFFFARVPLDRLPAMRPYFDQVVQSAVVP